MMCQVCNKDKTPWLLLKNDNLHVDEDGNNIGDTIYTCSYMCTQTFTKNLPKQYSNLVLNKEDFCYLKPILPKPAKNFEHLSFDEIMKLDEEKQVEYYTLRDKDLLLDSERYSIISDIEEEDRNTRMIENEQLSDEDEYLMDDY